MFFGPGAAEKALVQIHAACGRSSTPQPIVKAYLASSLARRAGGDPAPVERSLVTVILADPAQMLEGCGLGMVSKIRSVVRPLPAGQTCLLGPLRSGLKRLRF